ncbi:MAG: hypothetical protein IJZ85_13850 [Lachnospiraceae bacterium]|nr:hypothetical protein [Lachnospiraceae bacterium]
MEPDSKQSGRKRFKRILHRYYRLFGVLFVLLIFGLAILTALLPDQDYSASEKRSLTKFPELTLSSVADGSFMDGMEDWAADQFPLRNKLMQAKSSLSIGLGAIRSQDVYRCNDGSLMEAFSLPSDDLITSQAASIIDFAERYPNKDIYFCLVPTAISVLEEKLPAATLTDDQNLYLDRMMSAVNSVSTVIDLRDTFAKNKSTTELYYHTDHHWTTDAAYLAWKDLSDVMALDSKLSYTAGIVCNDFAGSLLSASGFSANAYDAIKVYVPEENPLYTLTYDTEKRMTASVYCPEYLDSEDPYQIFFGGNYPKLTIRTAQDTDRKLLVFKDSYANCLLPFLIPDFAQITVIDPRYYYDDLDMEIQSVGYTDVLFLYNANTLAEDSCLVPVLKNEQ